MEKDKSTNLPLLLRLSMDPSMESPPKLLARMTTPPPRKRRRRPSNKSSERWRHLERESTPVSKRQHESPTSWTSGLEHQKRIKGKPSTHTLQRSTPSLLSRMKSGQQPGEPHLLEQFPPLSHERRGRGSERRSMSFWTRYPGKSLKGTKSSSELSERGPRKRICLGIAQTPDHLGEEAASKPAESSSSSAKIYPGSNHFCESLTTSQRESLPLNGIESSEANQLISTKSSLPCTLSRLMKRERDAWEVLRSYLPRQNPNDRSRQGEIGPQRTGECPRRSRSFSPTVGRNYQSTPNISRDSSPRSTRTPIPRSSCMTSQSTIELEEGRISYSPITNASAASVRPYCMPTELSTEGMERGRRKEGKDQPKEG